MSAVPSGTGRGPGLRVPLIATSAVLVASCLLSFVAGGEPAGRAAALASAVVLVFFVTGAVPVLLVGRRGQGGAALFPLVLLGYPLRLVLVLLAVREVAARVPLDRVAFAALIGIGAFTWTVACVLSAARQPQEVIAPPPDVPPRPVH